MKNALRFLAIMGLAVLLFSAAVTECAVADVAAELRTLEANVRDGLVGPRQRPLERRWIFGIANSELGTVADQGNPTVQLKHSIETRTVS